MEGSQTTARSVVVWKPPLAVSSEDREEHEASGHVAHRSWCVHCVVARGSMHPHLTAPVDTSDGVPRICVDYFFMGDEEDSMCLLAVKQTIDKLCASTVLE